MKVRLEVDPDLPEDEVLIRCRRADAAILRLRDDAEELSRHQTRLVLFKENREFYFSPDEVLFFETDSERVYAHTENDAYLVKYRLYELESLLPRYFLRASKSAVVNSLKICSIERLLTASSLLRFSGSHKQLYVSRHYYKELHKLITERSRYE